MPFESDQGIAASEASSAAGPTGFAVHPERDGDDYVLKLSGELDLAMCDLLTDELKRAEANEAKRILLDLSSLSFIDSTGIRVLVQAHRRSAENGNRLRLSGVSGQVRDVLELTGVFECLEVAD